MIYNSQWLLMFVNLDGRGCSGREANYYAGYSSCFASYDESINWFLARNKCLKRGGDLATLTDTTDSGITTLLNGLKYKDPVPSNENKGKQYWIGLRKVWWKWLSGHFQLN